MNNRKLEAKPFQAPKNNDKTTHKKAEVPKPVKLLKSNSITIKSSNLKDNEPLKNEIKFQNNLESLPENNQKYLALKRKTQGYKLINEELKKELKDLKIELEEKEKMIEIFQKSNTSGDFSQNYLLLLKTQLLKYETHIKYLTNSVKSNKSLSTEIEYFIEEVLNNFEKLLKIDDLNEIHDQLFVKLGDLKILQGKFFQNMKSQNLQYEKFLNKSYLKFQTSEKNFNDKKLLFSLEEDLSALCKSLINDKKMELHENYGFFVKKIKSMMEKMLILGMKVDDYNNESEEWSNKALQTHQKNVETSKEMVQKIFQNENNIFNNNKENLEKLHDKNFYHVYENIETFTKEINLDISKIVEKYEKVGNINCAINKFIEKNAKFFQNNAEAKNEFINLATFLKNDIFFFSKLSHILEYLLLQNSILFGKLSDFVEIKLRNITEKIEENVCKPLYEMLTLYKEKNEMKVESYFIQLSYLFEYNFPKIFSTLEGFLKLEKNNQEVCGNEDELSSNILIKIYKEIKKKYFLNCEK